MTHTERIRNMVEHKPVDRVGISGWVHMPMVDRNVKDFTKATIDFTDNMNWDFIKLMSNGHYFAEAYGAQIRWRNDPKEWSGEILRYPVRSAQDAANLPVLDPKENPVFQRELQIAKNVTQHYAGSVPVIATIFTPLTWLQEMSSSCQPTPLLKMISEDKKAVRKALDALLETNLKLLDQFIEAGVDGIFLSTQFGTRNLLSKELREELCHQYDRALLEHIKDRTCFNMLHVHYCEDLVMEEYMDYPVQAFNWENCTACPDMSRLTSIRQVREMTDKIIIGGIDQHNDFHDPNNDRELIKERLRRRLLTALEECGDYNFVFAPGCALPMDVDRYVFTLMEEVVEEEGLAK